ncbi:MAG: sulfatase [Planctomycetaceae bacterium]|nr:sulfatase [Planctomycetaceae bacterium]
MDNALTLARTRRHFFHDCGVGVGSMALASLLARDAGAVPERKDPLVPKKPHFPAKAKAVIFLFMAGAPSQLELFEPKPKLNELSGQKVPESFTMGKRFAFIKGDAKILGTNRKFNKAGKCGMDVSELLPHHAEVADELCWIRSMKTDVFNHGPAKCFVNTGSPQFGRPSMGSWLTYGLGSECDSLPGFVVLQSGPRGPRGGASLYGSGFLPSIYQGVPFLRGSSPILDLAPPPGVDLKKQGEFVDAVKDLNKLRLDATGDPEIATRIAAYEMAFRMQTSAPELTDLSKEDKKTLDLYGVTPGKPSFGTNCLLARRLVQRGVRFVQLYHTDWDMHGGGLDLGKPLDNICKEIDQPCAALVKDLKRMGLLDSTIVVWGGEFGRTPMGETRETIGRDHHIDAYTMWVAGGGFKPGMIHGQTDEIGYNVTENPVHVHDLQATILNQMGMDHTKLTYRFQGRDYRLTDVHGHVVKEVLV